MSVNTNPVTNQPVLGQQPNAQAPQIPTFLQTANKVTKLIAAAIFFVVAIGSFGIGITMMPFAPEAAIAATAFGAAILTAAGLLLSSGLSSRDVTAHP